MYETLVRPQIFKGKMPITEELVRWNKYKGDILNRSKSLGAAAIQSVNRYAARPFIGGFTSTVTSYGDAEESLKKIALLKLLLNNGEVLTGQAEDNPRQAGESRAAATTKRRGYINSV